MIRIGERITILDWAESNPGEQPANVPLCNIYFDGVEVEGINQLMIEYDAHTYTRTKECGILISGSNHEVQEAFSNEMAANGFFVSITYAKCFDKRKNGMWVNLSLKNGVVVREELRCPTPFLPF